MEQTDFSRRQCFRPICFQSLRPGRIGKHRSGSVFDAESESATPRADHFTPSIQIEYSRFLKNQEKKKTAFQKAGPLGARRQAPWGPLQPSWGHRNQQAGPWGWRVLFCLLPKGAGACTAMASAPPLASSLLPLSRCSAKRQENDNCDD